MAHFIFNDRSAVVIRRARARLTAWLFGACLLLVSGMVQAAGCPDQNITVSSGGTTVTDLSVCTHLRVLGYGQLPQHGPILPENSGPGSIVYYTNDGLGAATDSFTIHVEDLSEVRFNVTVIQPLTINTSGVPGASVGVAYSQTLAASGGVPPYTWAVLPDSLPGGMSLSPAGVLSGTPSQAGIITPMFTVTDSQAEQASKTFPIIVGAPTMIVTPASMPNPAVGTAYSQSLGTNGGTAPYTYAVSGGTVPPGLSVSGGVLSGVPTTAGSFVFTISSTDSSTGTAAPFMGSRSYALTVAAGRPGKPTAVMASADAGPAGSMATAVVGFTAPADNGGSPIVVYTVTSSPGNITASGGGSPINVAGLTRGTNYTFSVVAGNGTSTGDASDPSNPVTPRITDSVTFGNPGTQNFGTSPTLTATASSGRAITFASNTGAVCIIGASSGQLTFLSAGSCSITAAVDGTSPYEAASQTRIFTVSPVVPGAPMIGAATTSPAPANQTTGSATVSFAAPTNTGGSPVSDYTVTSVPDNITATGAGSPMVVTGLTPGVAYRFIVTAANAAGTGGASAISNAVTPTRAQVITLQNPGTLAFGTTTPLNVSSTSGLPVTVTSSTASCDVIATNQVRALAPGTCTLQATQAGDPGVEPAPPVQQSFLISVPGGAVTINTLVVPAPTRGVAYLQPILASGGAQPYSYQQAGTLPNGIDFNGGMLSGVATQTGTFNFSVTVFDAALQSASQNYSFTVIAPTFVITPATLPVGKVGEAYATTTLSTAGGIAPYSYAVVAGALPAGVDLSPVGTLSGTPTAAGTASLTIQATDAYGAISAQAFSIAVGQQAPVAANDVANTAANAAVTVAVTNNDTGGAVTSIAIIQPPAHGVATVSGLDVVYTPAQDFSGTDTLTYTATGPGGTSNPATVTLAVASGAVPTVTGQTVSVLAGKPVTVSAVQGAAHGPFTAVAVASAPANGTVVVQGTDLVYTPGEDASGDITFTYTLSNAFGASQPGTVTVTVNPLPVAPAVVATAQAGRNLRVNISAGARGGPFTGANVVSVTPANAGTARVESTADGYVLLFDAAPAFGGVAQIGYALSNAYTTSATGFVSITVTARADPSKDAEVTGILGAQADATRRMATGQISNFQRRLEQLHNGPVPAGFSNGITLTSASANHATLADDGSSERVHGPSAFEDASDAGGPLGGQRGAPAAGNTVGLLPGGASVWTGGAVNFGKTGSTRGDASTDFTTTGLSMGADRQFAEGLILGAGVGYGRDDTDVGSQASSSKVDSYSAAVYASYRPSEAWFIDSLLGYQWLSLDSVRSLTDTDGRVVGTRDGTQWFGSVSIGYILRSDDVQVTPYGRFDTAQASLDGFTERGDDLHALRYQAQTVKTSTASAGVLAQFAVKRDYGVWAPQLRAEYGRDLEGASNALMSYADLMGGTVYRANLLQRSRDHALLGAGLGLQTLLGWNLTLEYQVQLEFGSGNNQSVRFGLEKKFEP